MDNLRALSRCLPSALSSVTNPSPIKRSLSRLRFAARTAAAA
jgi:hypothetical protein